jgi:hypothetical protein
MSKTFTLSGTTTWKVPPDELTVIREALEHAINAVKAYPGHPMTAVLEQALAKIPTLQNYVGGLEGQIAEQYFEIIRIKAQLARLQAEVTL